MPEQNAHEFSTRVKAAASLMIKPVGSACNLDCDYCYYLDVADDLYDGRSQRMSLETLEQTLRDYIKAAPDNATLCWQGGEPTLAGLDFFKHAVRIQKEAQRPGQQINHALQTNGTLLNDEWCRFFHDEKFLIGISVDGGPPLHDMYRKDKLRKNSHAKVMRGLKLLRKHRVEHNILCVLHRENVKHPRHLFEYLLKLGETWLQFIPAIEWENDPNTGEPVPAPYSPLPEDYGRFLCETFDLWFAQYRHRVSVRDIDTALQRLVFNRSTLCIYSESCHRQLTIESNGDVFGCDHFVESRWRIGSIHEPSQAGHVALTINGDSPRNDPPEEPDSTPSRYNWLDATDYDTLQQFAKRKLDLPETCLNCRFFSLCHGGCPKDRPHRGDIPEPSYLCAGYKMFFNHALERLEWMAQYLRQGMQPPPL